MWIGLGLGLNNNKGFEPVTITCERKCSTTKLGVNLLLLLHWFLL